MRTLCALRFDPPIELVGPPEWTVELDEPDRLVCGATGAGTLEFTRASEHAGARGQCGAFAATRLEPSQFRLATDVAAPLDVTWRGWRVHPELERIVRSARLATGSAAATLGRAIGHLRFASSHGNAPPRSSVTLYGGAATHSLDVSPAHEQLVDHVREELRDYDAVAVVIVTISSDARVVTMQVEHRDGTTVAVAMPLLERCQIGDASLAPAPRRYAFFSADR